LLQRLQALPSACVPTIWQEMSGRLHAWRRLTRAATQGLSMPGPQRDARMAAATTAALAQGAGSSDPAPTPDEEPFAAADRQRLTVSRCPAACACGAAAARLRRLCVAQRCLQNKSTHDCMARQG